MHEERIDLTLLDSLADPEHAEALVAAINEAAAPELARRAAGGGVLAMLGSWAWPTLAAASLAAAVSAAALLSTGAPSSGDSLALADPAIEAIEEAEPVLLWLDADRGLVAADLVMALEGEVR